MPPTPTMRRASAAERPEMHAVQAYLRAIRPKSRDVASGTAASSERSTIGARVPSMSQKTAAAPGRSVSGRTASTRVSTGTRLVCPGVSARLLRLAAIGTAAGFFSGLFGVGGGTVIVPLLVLWLGYGEREATGTSLAAIVVIATAGVIVQALYGNVHPLDALIVGAPALAGVVAGAAFQQRIPERLVAVAFAVLLIVSAILLVF